MSTKPKKSQHSLDDQIKFIKGARELVHKNDKVEIIIDWDNVAMLLAIEESLGELKLHE